MEKRPSGRRTRRSGRQPRPSSGARRGNGILFGISRPHRPQARKRGRGPNPLQLLVLAALLLLAAWLASLAWEAINARRAELSKGPDLVEKAPPWSPVVKSGVDSWPDGGLARATQGRASPEAGDVSIYIKSLNSGATAGKEEDRAVESASLFKIPILVEVLRQRDLRLLDMDTPILLEQKHWADGAGVLQSQIGKSFAVRELLDLMIGISDNVAALALLDRVGTDNVNLTLQANGLRTTRLRVGEPSHDWGGQPGENTTTAREMGTLLERLATGKILGERSSEEAIRLLSQKQPSAWLSDLLPSGARLAHKTGELDGIRHDAGIIYGPRNQFVAVVLTTDVSDYDKAARSIAQVARAAYDYFESGER